MMSASWKKVILEVVEREQEPAESIVPKQHDFVVLQSRREQQEPNSSYEFM